MVLCLVITYCHVGRYRRFGILGLRVEVLHPEDGGAVF